MDFGAAATIGSSLIGGLFGRSSAKATNAANAAAAERANEFTREQMKNRHQWEVADLRAAGLNPVLSAGGTPSMGSSAKADVINPGDSAVNAATSAASLRLLNEQVNKAKSEVNLNKSLENSAQADAKFKLNSAKNVAIRNVLDAMQGPEAAVNSAWYSSKIGQASEAVKRTVGGVGAGIGTFFGGIGSAFTRNKQIGFKIGR